MNPHCELPPRSTVTATPEMSVRPFLWAVDDASCAARISGQLHPPLPPGVFEHVPLRCPLRCDSVAPIDGAIIIDMNAKSPIIFRARQSAIIAARYAE